MAEKNVLYGGIWDLPEFNFISFQKKTVVGRPRGVKIRSFAVFTQDV